ncbi:hypothetical protein PSTG_17909, partial [Puccinia striiformis f. sp. tritici PST-78]
IGFVAPSSVDKKTFGFRLDNRLEAKTNPVFGDVSTIIQLACGQHKNKAVETSTSYAPMDLDTIQAFRQQQAKYVHPNQRNSPTQSSPSPADHNCHLRKFCSIT